MRVSDRSSLALATSAITRLSLNNIMPWQAILVASPDGRSLAVLCERQLLPVGSHRILAKRRNAHPSIFGAP